LSSVLDTDRLCLRGWRDEDLAPFAELNADPQVMEYLPRALTRSESDELAGRIRAHHRDHRFGLWAAEEVASGTFIGFVGLSIPQFEAPFMPCVEIGWRLARPFWGLGYATEAASAAMRFGFEQAKFEEIVSFTVPMNQRSRSVMTRLGMQRKPEDDFEHPGLPAGHRLRAHVLYRTRQSEHPTHLQAEAQSRVP
jgi:RimJ/RimL family protein N-acetyltransferase